MRARERRRFLPGDLHARHGMTGWGQGGTKQTPATPCPLLCLPALDKTDSTRSHLLVPAKSLVLGITLRPRAGSAHWAGPVAPCVAALCRRTGPRGVTMPSDGSCSVSPRPLLGRWSCEHTVRGGSTGRKRGIVGAQAGLLRALPCRFPIYMEREHDGAGITSPRRGPHRGG